VLSPGRRPFYFQKATDPLSFYEAFSSGFSGILVDITISIRK
jgi:hypothetical protein